MLQSRLYTAVSAVTTAALALIIVMQLLELRLLHFAL